MYKDYRLRHMYKDDRLSSLTHVQRQQADSLTHVQRLQAEFTDTCTKTTG